MSRVSLKPGSIAPNFEGSSADGPIKFYQWSENSWTIVFSHPGSSISKELYAVARRLSDIDQRGIKIIGFSRNWQEESQHWDRVLHHYDRQFASGKNIADDQGRLSDLYEMLPHRDHHGVVSNVSSSPNTAFLVDPRKVIKLVLSYPSFLSTDLNQILRYTFTLLLLVYAP
ncbi:thioredoxin-like protein [Lentinula raphanica]|nr:thioredoxin-like protein [Lentinula raphanica]